MYHQLGARSLALTHNCNNPWADSSLVDKPGNTPVHGGLTAFGKTVIKEMNRLGMIVDLSHSSKKVTLLINFCRLDSWTILYALSIKLI